MGSFVTFVVSNISSYEIDDYGNTDTKDEDLDRGLCRALADSIVELQGYGSPVHPNTQEALSYIQREIGGTIE